VVNYINDSTFLSDLNNAGMTRTPSSLARIIGGHSAGNHVALQRLKDFKCDGFGAVIMNSPVDGDDPFGITDDIVTPESGKLDSVIPALQITGSLDGEKLRNFPSCAPESMTSERFFYAWQGPIYKYEAEGAGHMG